MEEEAGNGSPPVERDSPSPELKRERKPGAKTVRWVDWSTADPLEKVREFEIDPNERGGLRPAERQVCQPNFCPFNFKFVKFIISGLSSLFALRPLKYDTPCQEKQYHISKGGKGQ